jgi:putative ABC transport system substrate-binding protein
MFGLNSYTAAFPVLGAVVRRREFIGLAVIGAATWPLTARSQHDTSRRIPTIGFLGFATAATDVAIVLPFRQALADLYP